MTLLYDLWALLAIHALTLQPSPLWYGVVIWSKYMSPCGVLAVVVHPLIDTMAKINNITPRIEISFFM